MARKPRKQGGHVTSARQKARALALARHACTIYIASQPTARTHSDSRLPRGAQFRNSTINCTEAYPTTDRISWAHPENKYKNNVFADEERNIDTFNEAYFGCVVVKENKRSGCQGGAALILCLSAGQIAL